MSYQVELPVVGVSFHNDDTGEKRQDILNRFLVWHTEMFEECFDFSGTPIESIPNPVIEARREPWNKYDAKAVAIHGVSPEHCAGRVGYISRDDAAKVSQRMNSGQYLGCSLSSIGRGQTSNCVGIRVFLRFEGEHY